MQMKCLTAVLLAVLTVADQPRPTFLRKPAESSLQARLQQALKDTQEEIEIVTQDLALLKMIGGQDVQQEDADQVRKVVSEDQTRLQSSTNSLKLLIKELEDNNLRSEFSLLYRAANESLKHLLELSSSLSAVVGNFPAKSEDTSLIEVKKAEEVVIPMHEIVLPAPTVDQMLQIAVCLETLLRAHKDANDILEEIRGEQEAIEQQQSALKARKQTLRGVIDSKAEVLQKHKELVAEAKVKVAKALEALQDSQRLLEEKAKLIDDLEARIRANF